jgi:hypothetical protein
MHKVLNMRVKSVIDKFENYMLGKPVAYFVVMAMLLFMVPIGWVLSPDYLNVLSQDAASKTGTYSFRLFNILATVIIVVRIRKSKN